MSELIDRTITFEPLVRGNNPNAITSVDFTIEPPINVHNADFLNDAVQELGWNNMSGDFPIIDAVKLQYSDDESTHGIIKVKAFTSPEKFQSLVESSFVPALSLGKNVVQLVFKSET